MGLGNTMDQLAQEDTCLLCQFLLGRGIEDILILKLNEAL